MSCAEHSRDDAEPPSSILSTRPLSTPLLTVLLSVDESIEPDKVPSTEHINAWIAETLQGVPSAHPSVHHEVSVSVVDEPSIQQLNRDYRNSDKPTNVLSFPSDMPQLPTELDEGGFQVLGDVVVCQSVILTEADEQNKPLEHHWAHMLVHSVLHLVGYDHLNEAEANTMEALEIQILRNLSIPNPYQVSFQKP